MKRIIPVVLIISLFLAGCAGEKPVEGEKISANVLFIIAQKDFRDEELSTPKQILESAGCSCDVASITTEPAKGVLGATVTPELAVKDADINNYDMVVVVGGPGAPDLMDYPEVLSLLQQAEQQNKKIASICLGPMVLAPKGTAAHWRIERGLVYSDPTLYEKLSKKIQSTMKKLEDKTKFLETVFPKSVKNFLSKVNEGDKVARLWKPKKA